MGKGLSEQQRIILEEANAFEGKAFKSFVEALKVRLFPSLWYMEPAMKVFDDGRVLIGPSHLKRSVLSAKERKAARASISRSIRRLKERGLIAVDKGMLTPVPRNNVNR